MEYSFSGTSVVRRSGSLTLFWGASPHGVTRVDGDGEIINIYVSFSQILRWGLPEPFLNSLIAGDVMSATAQPDTDPSQFRRWTEEIRSGDSTWRQLVLGEVEMRVRRFALEGWETVKPGYGRVKSVIGAGGAMQHIEEMLRFIADRYCDPISVTDVADSVGLSPSYAMTLFRRVVGVPIKEHITRIRLSHAQMLLSNSDDKILSIAMDSGFGSLSSFYEAFQSHLDTTPSAFRRNARR
ncbi:MAG: AraC family transcriptional regulator [Geminicoccus sp.]|nr:AraC family transcriptional regulator [Geminicoccus sp.]MBB24259.1 AraC family transcriptional regulator [Geminicoccus sp.]